MVKVEDFSFDRVDFDLNIISEKTIVIIESLFFTKILSKRANRQFNSVLSEDFFSFMVRNMSSKCWD